MSLRPGFRTLIGEVVAIASQRLGEHAPGVLARLAGPIGDGARRAAALAKRERIELVTSARAPVPPGFRAVHATWIEATLAALPPRARTVLADGARDPVEVWLARWATAGWPPVADPPAGHLDRQDLPPNELIAWLVGIGADQLAFALGPQAASFGPTVVAALARIAKPPRLGELGPQRAAITRCRDVVLDDELGLIRIAGRALAPHLAIDPLARLQITRRLPRPIGAVVEHELHAHAATSLDHCPTWAALESPR